MKITDQFLEESKESYPNLFHKEKPEDVNGWGEPVEFEK